MEITEKGEMEINETEKIKIGIDIDDTILDWFIDFILFCKNNFNYSLSSENHIYYLKEDFGSEENFISAIKEYALQERTWKMNFFDDFLEVSNLLFDNFDVFFITSRVYDDRIKTLKFLRDSIKKNFTLIYSKDFENFSKGEICFKNGVKIMVEDCKKHSIDCAEKGIKVFLIDKPWNQNCEHENIVRVKNWKDLLENLEVIK